MMYELIMTYDDGTMKKEQAKLPNLMSALGIYMEDNDWSELIDAINASSKKYKKLRPEETAFYDEITFAFMNLVEHEIKTEVEVENKYPCPTTRIWVDSEKAKNYGLDIPKREPNK